MRNIWTISVREYKKYFASPAAYLIAFMILLIVGIFFFLSLNLAFATPAVTARLIADERKLGTIELLLTAPVRDWELIVGKWLGSLLFMLTIIAVRLLQSRLFIRSS
jgi:ABC-2 type transport system permease protein